MDTLKVRVRVDAAAALRAGKNQHGEVEVPVPEELTPQQRETLLTANHNARGAGYDYAFDLAYGRETDIGKLLPAIPDASPASIALLLDAWPAAKARAQAEEVAKATKDLEDALAGNRALFSTAGVSRAIIPLLPPGLWDRYKAAEQHRDDERQAKYNIEKRQQEARAERRKAEEKAARDMQNQWIAEYGSPRLKRCLAENLPCDAVYRDERLALEYPGWSWLDKRFDLNTPRNPPEKAFALLDEARLTSTNFHTELKYYTYEEENDDNFEVLTERGYCAIATFLERDIIYDKRVVLNGDDE